MAKNSQAMAATKAGYWNWNPQPAVAPAARSPSNNSASARQHASTPAV
jgi:hypothetical protein